MTIASVILGMVYGVALVFIVPGIQWWQIIVIVAMFISGEHISHAMRGRI